MINDEMPIDMFRKMMEQLKRIEQQLISNRKSTSQYVTITERSNSNIDLKINIANSQMSSLKINVNEGADQEGDNRSEQKQMLDLSAKREKDKNSRVQRNQQKFQPISRISNTVQIEPNSPIQCKESQMSSFKDKFYSEGKSSKNQNLPLATSYFELSLTKLDDQLVSDNKRSDEKIVINKQDNTQNSNLGKQGVSFPLCLQTPIKAITDEHRITSESRRNIEQLQSIANRNKLLFENKNSKQNSRQQQSNYKWAIQSSSKVLKQQKIMKPQKGYSDMFIEKNKLKQTPLRIKGNQRYNTIACEDQSRLNYNSRRSVSRDKLTQYFAKKANEEGNSFTLPLKEIDGQFEQSKKQVLLKLRKKNNLQNSLRKSSKQANVSYIHIKTTQKKKKPNMLERQNNRQKSSSIEQITQRLHSGKGKDPCVRFRDRGNSLLKDEFNKIVRKSSLAKRNIGKQDREILYQQLRKSKDSTSLWPSIITSKALELAKSKRRQHA